MRSVCALVTSLGSMALHHVENLAQSVCPARLTGCLRSFLVEVEIVGPCLGVCRFFGLKDRPCMSSKTLALQLQPIFESNRAASDLACGSKAYYSALAAQRLALAMATNLAEAWLKIPGMDAIGASGRLIIGPVHLGRPDLSHNWRIISTSINWVGCRPSIEPLTDQVEDFFHMTRCRGKSPATRYHAKLSPCMY